MDISLGYDWRNSQFFFGNLATDEKTQQWYSSINWKHYFQEDWILQAGVSSQRNTYRADIVRPTYFFANLGESPTISNNYDLDHWSPEAYLYFKMPISERISLGLGTRTTLPGIDPLNFTSYQANLKYQITEDQQLLLAGGHYNNILAPGFFTDDFQLLASDQLSLEYSIDQYLFTSRSFLQARGGGFFPR